MSDVVGHQESIREGKHGEIPQSDPGTSIQTEDAIAQNQHIVMPDRYRTRQKGRES